MAFAESPSAATLLVFRLGEMRYAIDAALVREVVRAVRVAPLPSTVSLLEGAIDVRGEVIPVIDIRERLGVSRSALHPDQHFVIAQAGPRTVTLRVDEVLDHVEASAADIAPAATIPGLARVAGLARRSDGLVVIVDLERFLSLDEARAVDDAVHRATGAHR